MSRRVDSRLGLEDANSATALETYDLCPRKWAWRKLDGIEAPPNPSADFGIGTHGQLEGWLRDGKPLDMTTEHGECAFSGLHLLPPPKSPGMVVEGEFLLQAWGHKFYGLKDIEFATLPPHVWDHKTTKDFKWAKTPEQLVTNIQAALYAADAMVKTGARECDLTWVYYRTKRPYQARPVHTRVTREQIEPTLLKIKRLSDEIRAIKSAGLRAKDLPFNPDACEAYGGCPYKQHCNLQPSDVLRAIMQQGTGQPAPSTDDAAKADLYARIAAKQAAAQGAAPGAINPPPPPAAAAPGVPPGAHVSPDGTQYWNGSAWVPVPSAAPPPPPPPPPAAAPPPPPPPPPPAPAAPPGVPPGAAVSPDGTQYWNGSAWVPVPPPAAAPPPPPPPPPPAPAAGGAPLPAAPESPRKRGRPRKNPAPGAPAADMDPAEMYARGLEMQAAAIRAGLFDFDAE